MSPNMRSKNQVQLRWLTICATLGSLVPHAPAIITYGGTGNNFTAPPNGVGSYELNFGSFLATAISPTVMVTANHIGGGSKAAVIVNGMSYNFQIAAALDDLTLWEFSPNQTGAAFSSYAPLYTGSSEVGSSLIVVGRGDARGTPITGGWDWAAGTNGPVSWGTNTVSAILSDSQIGESGAFGGDFLEYDFSNNATDPNEAILASGDSGGGVFVESNGVYYLDGVNSLVDTVLDSSGNPLQAALYDTYGYYYKNSSGTLVQITSHDPESSYATRISTKLNLIGAVDGSISPSNAAAYPISNDGNLSIYTDLTTGAITGGALVTIGGPNTPNLPATLQIAPNSGASRIDSLTIDSGSALDITNTHVIISNTNSAAQTRILGYLATGYNGGAWNGNGIISSTAAAGNAHYGVGYASAGAVSGLYSGQVEIAYTLYGDTNLDGSVNSVDFGTFAAHFGQSVSGGWQLGDFDYNGVVNSNDFGLLAQNFGKSASGRSVVVSDADWDALDAFAASNGMSSSLPEPVAAGLLALTGLRFLTRRPRRRTNGC
jgi:hypothetical protein